MSKSSQGSGFPSITGLLGLLFVGLKLTGYINWPWIWVVAPFWLPLAIFLVIMLIIFVLQALLDNR